MPLPLAAIYGLTALGTAVFGTAGYQTLKNLGPIDEKTGLLVEGGMLSDEAREILSKGVKKIGDMDKDTLKFLAGGDAGIKSHINQVRAFLGKPLLTEDSYSHRNSLVKQGNNLKGNRGPDGSLR